MKKDKKKSYEDLYPWNNPKRSHNIKRKFHQIFPSKNLIIQD